MNDILKQTNIDDIDQIVHLAEKTIAGSYEYFLGYNKVKEYLKNGHLENYLNNNLKNTWALIREKKIIGLSICIENVIDFMLIDVDLHRQGLGTRLLKLTEAMLFAKYEVIALESFEKNTKANEFYINNNWIRTEKYKDPKHDSTKLIFRKYLNPSEEQ